jgi:hypothetical protein
MNSMKTTRILRCLFYSVIISVLGFARDVNDLPPKN